MPTPVVFFLIAAGTLSRAAGEYDVKLPAPLSPPEKMENITVAPGPFQPTWDSLQAYQAPDWFKDAKFGIWAHWGPQAEGRSGDWYARNIYMPGEAQDNHIKNFGHPSVLGYKDVLPHFKAEKWNPEELMALYKAAGARYFMAMGCHHDNIDCWNSQYQPWNTVNYGPRQDIVGRWEKAAKAQGLKFGVSFHADYSWWWYQDAFLGSEQSGPYKGVPYDAARLTKADGQGKWWQGLDPLDLYGKALPDEPAKGKWLDPSEKDGTSRYGNMPDELADEDKDYARWYCTKWCHRVQDLIHNYHPDLLYFDGGGGDYYPFSGVGTGRGFASDAMQRIIADFYNTNLQENGGKMDAVVNIKTDKGRALVLDHESGFPGDIPQGPWQTDNTIGDWFYRPNCFYDTGMVIHELLEVVSRNGNLMMNVMLSPEGVLDPQGRQTLVEMGKWMKANGEGIFGTHAWTIWGEGSTVMRGGILNQNNAMTPYTEADIRFTQSNDGKAIYAYCLNVPATPAPGPFDVPHDRVSIRSLGSASPLVTGEPTSVTLLGYSGKLDWKRNADNLEITLPAKLPAKYALCFKIEGLITQPNPNLPAEFRARLNERPNLIAGPDGAFDLKPNFARTDGPSIQLEWNNGIDDFGYWRSVDDRANWQIKVEKTGTYRIVLKMATPDKDIDLTATAGSQTLEARLPSTGSYDHYQSVPIGTIQLDQTGPVLVSLQGKPGGKWSPINLRGVRLVPLPTGG